MRGKQTNVKPKTLDIFFFPLSLCLLDKMNFGKTPHNKRRRKTRTLETCTHKQSRKSPRRARGVTTRGSTSARCTTTRRIVHRCRRLRRACTVKRPFARRRLLILPMAMAKTGRNSSSHQTYFRVLKPQKRKPRRLSSRS